MNEYLFIAWNTQNVLVKIFIVQKTTFLRRARYSEYTWHIINSLHSCLENSKKEKIKEREIILTRKQFEHLLLKNSLDHYLSGVRKLSKQAVSRRSNKVRSNMFVLSTFFKKNSGYIFVLYLLGIVHTHITALQHSS